MTNSSPAYQLFMLLLCVLALANLLLERVFRGDPEIAAVLGTADNVVSLVFLGDFFLSFVRAPDRKRYFLTWGWVDLLSAVPMLDAARWGRLARILRVFRVLRALHSSRLVTELLLRQRRQSAVLAATLAAFLLIIGSSAAILHFEDHPDSNIRTAGDAVWWAFTTITTVGYGDRFPLTTEGRLIAVLLMTAGVGLFGAFSAMLAAWFLVPEDEATDAELTAVRAEITEMRRALEALSAALPARSPDAAPSASPGCGGSPSA